MFPIVRIKVIVVLFLTTFGWAASIPETDSFYPCSKTGDHIVIVYLSRTKNTKAVAEIIHKQVGGNLLEIELEHPYPEDYKTMVAQVAKENEIGYLPALKTKIENINQFSVVFIGFPTWGMQLPPPIKSFLNQYDFGGKTIVPFNTHAGYGIGTAFKTINESCPNSTVLPGLSIKGGIERDGIYFVMEGQKEKEVRSAVQQWLANLGFS